MRRGFRSICSVAHAVSEGKGEDGSAGGNEGNG
jgi:hypothetical protein